MMHKNTTRRHLLGTIATLPVLAVAAPGAASASTPDRAAWDHALVAYRAAEAAVRTDDSLHVAARDAWEAARPNEGVVHWREFPFADRQQILWMDVDEAEAEWLAGEGKFWWSDKDSKLAAFESVREFRRQWAANPKRAALDEANDRNDALKQVRHQAECTIWSLRAPDLAALAWKVETILSTADIAHQNPDRLASTIDDVRRLMVGPAA